jgi:hypothetical protein
MTVGTEPDVYLFLTLEILTKLYLVYLDDATNTSSWFTYLMHWDAKVKYTIRVQDPRLAYFRYFRTRICCPTFNAPRYKLVYV